LKSIFYKADDGYTADIIPYFDGEKFRLFYLKDYRNVQEQGEGVPWFLVSTTNFVDFEENGEVISRGSKDSQDVFIFTGSIIKKENFYHIFYTGHNPFFRAKGKPEQAIMHAISTDMLKWKKIEEDTFYAPKDKYEEHDWRDPFVYYDEEQKKYCMLLAARLNTGAEIRRGCTAICTSSDLKNWNVRDEDFWAPNSYFTHECPDLFKIGKWYYLIFSEFTDYCRTRYRMSKSINGPWEAAKDDCFDGRAFYAAKSAANETNRYLFGWNPTKVDGDNSSWQWGGNLITHEIYQKEDNTLGVKMPESIKKAFSINTNYIEKISITSLYGTTVKSICDECINECRISLDIHIKSNSGRFGVLLNSNKLKDEAYGYLINTTKQRLEFIKFPNHPWSNTKFSGVEREYKILKDETYHLDILLKDNMCICYINNDKALTSRMYCDYTGMLEIISIDGNADFSNINIYKL
jgi:beta-fructofuranosidase